MKRTVKRIEKKLETVNDLRQACDDILEAAATTASTYWAEFLSLNRNSVGIFSAVCRDTERVGEPRQYTVTPAMIVAALEKLRDGKATTCHSRFIGPAALILAGRYDDASTDDEVHDVIFQIAALGQVVYG